MKRDKSTDHCVGSGGGLNGRFLAIDGIMTTRFTLDVIKGRGEEIG